MDVIDYQTTAIVGSVTVRRSADHTTIIVGPSLPRILPELAVPLGYCLLAAAIFAGLYWGNTRPDKSYWIMFGVPSIFIAVALWNIANNAEWIFFPITFEVTPDQMIIRWRKFTEAPSLAWPRRDILGVLVAKRNVNRNIFKTRGIFVHHRETGESLLLRSSHRELLFIADCLQKALGLPCSEPAAMTMPFPAKCRYQRVKWSDGVHIYIPPKWDKIIAAVLLIPCYTIAAFVLYVIFYDEDVTVPGAMIARYVLAAVLALMAWWALLSVIRQVRRKTGILADSATLTIIETGFRYPVQVQWKYDQLKSIDVVPHSGGGGREGSLHIVPQQGVPLVILQGEPIAHLQWIVAVLQAATPGVHALACSSAPPKHAKA